MARQRAEPHPVPTQDGLLLEGARVRGVVTQTGMRIAGAGRRADGRHVFFQPSHQGGPERGGRILSDSNVDWGLDLKRLARELQRRRVASPTIVFFGGDDVLYRTGVPGFAADPRIRSGLVAISAFQLAVGPEFLDYHGDHAVAAALKRLNAEIAARGRPVGRVGYSMYLFELP